MRYSRLWSRVYGSVLLIEPEKATIIERVFRSHLRGDGAVRAMEDEHEETAEQKAEREHQRRSIAYAGIPLQRRDDKPYAVTASGIALIPVLGTLVQRGSWLDAWSGLTSYDWIATMLDDAIQDPSVRGAILEIDSPGGEGSGIVDMAARIYAARGKKRVWSSANEMAYSAAYWIASASERVYVPITGGVGSIGALALHVDQSQRDAAMGYVYTFIYAGDRKIDLNSHQPLKADGRARLQAEVDRFYELFIADVSKGRDIPTEAVRGTQAALLTPDEALKGSFVDGVSPLRETVARLEAELAGSTSVITPRLAADIPAPQSSQENDMTDPKTPAAAAPNSADPGAPKHTTADLQSAADKAKNLGVQEGTAAGIKSERERIRGILSHAEAKDRPQLAMNLALESDMSLEQATAFMAKSAKEASGGNLARLMAGVKNPKVGADADPDPSAGAPQINTAEIYASRRKQAQLPH